jgi:hypothetical protein
MRQPTGVICDLAGTALEQDDAQFLFQLAHRDAQRRLTDMTPFGGAAKMPLARDGDDVTQFVESHGDTAD